MQSSVLAIVGISVCLSVSPSVSLSVTRWHWVKTTQATAIFSVFVGYFFGNFTDKTALLCSDKQSVIHCQQRKSSVGTLVSGSVRFVRIFARSLEKRRQMTVCSRVNARLKHLFLGFVNNCVNLNTDKPSCRKRRYLRKPRSVACICDLSFEPVRIRSHLFHGRFRTPYLSRVMSEVDNSTNALRRD